MRTEWGPVEKEKREIRPKEKKRVARGETDDRERRAEGEGTAFSLSEVSRSSERENQLSPKSAPWLPCGLAAPSPTLGDDRGPHEGRNGPGTLRDPCSVLPYVLPED